MIQRNYYLNRLIRNMWNGEIKVITGIRRCGKSVLLFELFDEYLRNHGTDATQIIKIELDQRRYYKYRNPITLCEYVEQLVLGQQDKKLYLFIDEVQLTAKVIDQENGGIEVTIYDMLNELKAYKKSRCLCDRQQFQGTVQGYCNGVPWPRHADPCIPALL